MTSSSSSFSAEEVSKHKTENDLWVASEGKVYDVSPFVRRHPGGWKVLLEHAGGDVTRIMSGPQGPHQHSKNALKMLDDFYIGELQEPEKKETRNGYTRENQIDQSTNQVVSRNDENDNSPADYDRIKKRYDDLVNSNHPMFLEIGKLGKFYMNWIFTPEDKDLRFFQSDIVEYLTTCQWYIIPIVWLPIITFFLCLSYGNFMEIGGHETWFYGIDMRTWMMPFLFSAGVLIWSISEYIIHRWVFHLRPPHWSRSLITLHFLFHGQHHKNPMNKNRLVFPPVPAMPFAIIIWLTCSSVFPKATGQSVLAGIAFGYVIYDLIHYYLHHGTPSIEYFKDLKNYHVKHHYIYHEQGFGISSKLWDYPFGTLISDGKNLKLN